MNRLNATVGHVSLSSTPSQSVSSTSGGTVTIIDNRTGKKIELPIIDGCIKATDLKQLGLQSFDPGYMNTTCCISRISWIDGNKGILRYRGIPIEVSS